MSNRALLDHVLDDIAIDGEEGTEIPYLVASVKEYYVKNPASRHNISSLCLSRNGSEEIAGEEIIPYEGTLEQIWSLLKQEKDFRIGPRNEGRHLCWKEIAEKLICDAADDERGAATGKKGFKWKVYISEERLWRSLTGHGKDFKKVPKASFQCLQIIGRHREEGILQTELTRLSGQDKRSVPSRTNLLSKRGYIEKISVLASRNTSKLTLTKFVARRDQSTKGQKQTADLGTPAENEDVGRLARTIVEHLKTAKNQALVQSDMARKLGMDSHAQLVTLRRLCNRLESRGIIKRIRVPICLENSAKVAKSSQKTSLRTSCMRCIKYIRDLKALDYRRLAIYTADSGILEDDAKDNTIGEEGNDGIVDEQGLGRQKVEQIGKITSDELKEPYRDIQHWNMNQPAVNTLCELVHSAGTDGISGMDLKCRLFGPFYEGPLCSMVKDLEDLPISLQTVQYPHLRIVREVDRLGRCNHYRYFSYVNHQHLVKVGRANYPQRFRAADSNAVGDALPGDISERGQSYGAGFARVSTSRFLKADRSGTLAESSREAMEEDDLSFITSLVLGEKDDVKPCLRKSKESSQSNVLNGKYPGIRSSGIQIYSAPRFSIDCDQIPRTGTDSSVSRKRKREIEASSDNDRIFPSISQRPHKKQDVTKHARRVFEPFINQNTSDGPCNGPGIPQMEVSPENATRMSLDGDSKAMKCTQRTLGFNRKNKHGMVDAVIKTKDIKRNPVRDPYMSTEILDKRPLSYVSDNNSMPEQATTKGFALETPPLSPADVIPVDVDGISLELLPLSDIQEDHSCGLTGGMLSIAKQQVILDLLAENGGVFISQFQGNKSLKDAYSTRYSARTPGHPRIRADTRTLRMVLNALRRKGKINEIAFQCPETGGELVTKKIIANANIPLDSPLIAGVARRLITAGRRQESPVGDTICNEPCLHSIKHSFPQGMDSRRSLTTAINATADGEGRQQKTKAGKGQPSIHKQLPGGQIRPSKKRKGSSRTRGCLDTKAVSLIEPLMVVAESTALKSPSGQVNKGAVGEDRKGEQKPLGFSLRLHSQRQFRINKNVSFTTDTHQLAIPLRRSRRRYNDSNEHDDTILIACVIIRTIFGHGFRMNWDVMRKTMPQYEINFARRRWQFLCRTESKSLETIQTQFENIFLAAYAADELPTLDISNSSSFDLSYHVAYFRKVFRVPDANPEISPNLMDLYETCTDEAACPFADYRNGRLSARSRIEIIANHAYQVPFIDVIVPQDPGPAIEYAESVIKANITTGSEGYDPFIALKLLQSLPENTVIEATHRLLDSGVIVRCHERSYLPGRNYELSDKLLASLNQCMDAKIFLGAVEFCSGLRDAFEKDAAVKVDPTVSDGAMASILDLLAQKNIRLGKKEYKANILGLTDGDGYVFHGMDEELYGFTVTIIPTCTFPMHKKGKLPEVPLQDSLKPIPLWCNLKGQLMHSVWLDAVAAVLCRIIFQPGIPTEELKRIAQPGLTAFEVSEAVKWLVSKGAVAAISYPAEGLFVLGGWHTFLDGLCDEYIA